MISIGKPVIEQKDDKIYFKAFVSNDTEKKNEWMWFATNVEYGQYFTEDHADAFVLPMILRAVKTQQDIKVDSSMSEKLYYHLNDSVFSLVNYAYEKKNGKRNGKKIKLYCDKLISTNCSPQAVGTGCSLGVDSFTELKKHVLSEDCPPSYKITHPTLFNAGAFGANEAARQSFYKEIQKTENFTKEIGLPLIWVDSNIREFFPEFSFNWCHTYLNMAIVLSMQKLWKKYFYASGYSAEYFKFDIRDSAFYEPYLLPHLSTESTELISGSMTLRRSKKIEYIADDPIVQKHLYVCLKEQILNNPRSIHKYYGDFLNCGMCEKCLRTMLQLDILGVLDDFKNIFDLSKWPELKLEYITKVIIFRESDLMYHDLYLSMKEHNYPIPSKVKIDAKIMELKGKLKRKLFR